jgi:hypothetical protein
MSLRDSEAIQLMASVLPNTVRLIERVIALTEPLRHEAPTHLRERLWLFRPPRGRNAHHVTAIHGATINRVMTTLIKECPALRDADGTALRVNISRMRKTFGNRVFEIVGEDLSLTAKVLGNTPRVADNHYMVPGEHAEKNWRFMGNLLVQELREGSLASHAAKTPVGRCSDPKNGQFAPMNGATCTNFLNCLRCRAYVVTGDDLYRIFSFYWLVVRERAQVDTRTWARHYGHVIRIIDRDIAAAGVSRRMFTQAKADAERARAHTTPHPYWTDRHVLRTIP